MHVFTVGSSEKEDFDAGKLSAVQPVLFVVLQGSILGQLLYLLYTAELGLVVARHGLNLHHYADDTQVRSALRPGMLRQPLHVLMRVSSTSRLGCTPTRLKLCGWVLPSSWPKSTF